MNSLSKIDVLDMVYEIFDEEAARLKNRAEEEHDNSIISKLILEMLLTTMLKIQTNISQKKRELLEGLQ